MGKRLIIKGANFSSVAVDKEVITRWLFNDVDWDALSTNYSNANGTDISGRSVNIWPSAAAGKKIIAVKLKVKNLGTGKLKIGVVRNLLQYIEPGHPKSSFSIDDMPVETQELTITEAGVVTIQLPAPIVLGPNDWIGLGRWDLTDPVASIYLDESKNVLYVNGPNNATPYTIVDFSNGSIYAPMFYDLLYEVE